MVPPNKPTNNNSMKQKSLMGWLSKTPTQTAQPKAIKATQKAVTQPKDQGMARTESAALPSTSKEVPSVLRTPPQKNIGSGMEGVRVVDLSSSIKSMGSSSTSGFGMKDTPPTSDTVDVAMDSDDGIKPGVSKNKMKRKNVMADSDEDEAVHTNAKDSFQRSSSVLGKSSPTANVMVKKPRVSYIESEDEDEDEDSKKKGSTKRLSRFRRPEMQKKGGTSSDWLLSDEEFIPQNESDIEVPLTSSRRGSSVSSSRSGFATSSTELEEYDSDVSEAPARKSGKKAKKPAKPDLKKSQSNGGSNGGSGRGGTFLTAAEQREREKKSEKKATEDAFDFLKDVRDKDKNRPGDPGYDPRTIYVPREAWASFTPFEKQFWEIKQNHYDTVLFFQKGKFLELYEDDARIGHQEFDLKLTERVKMSMVGVPDFSFGFWAAKFLGKGYKVGKVEQAETALGAEMRLAADKQSNKSGKKKSVASGDKIVRRALSKVYTNGTLVDAELLIDEQAGHCVSLRELDPTSDKNTFGVCVLDTSTSEFNLSAFQDDACLTKLETLMRQLRVKELVFTKGNLSVATTRTLKSVLPGSTLWTGLRDCEGFQYEDALKEVKKLYPDTDDDIEEGSSIPDAIREMLDSKSAIEALGSMIWYLRQLNIDKDILSMKNFNIYDPMKRGQGLVLDGQTLAHVEILQNSEGTDEGSLLRILGRCITPFGKRLFRIWLCMPLRETVAINTRLDAVQDLINHPTFESDFTNIVKGMPDLERVVSRIHAKNCKIRDFLKVLSSFRKLSKGLESLCELAETFDSKGVHSLLRSAPSLELNIQNIEDMFERSEDDPSELIPREGKDAAYDKVTEEIKELEDELDEALKKMKKELGCELSYWHSAVGTKDIYLVQTNSKQNIIPNNWTKHGGTKAVSRWLVPSLAKPIRKLKEERERRSVVIKEFKFRLFAEFDQDRDIWLRAVRTIAELDCLLSLAKSSIAIGEPSCRPIFIDNEEDGASFEFEELRHPALCLKNEDFIPNNVRLGGGAGRVALLTGPNMGGKSTVMRMTAVGVIMAQLGMLVPAKSAKLSPVDAILTRMGAYDNMFSNASTFKVELDECCKILRDATPRSLVILDELGRGTSTYDGMAIAGAVLHQLATHTLPLCFFATHYGSLTDDFAYHPNVRNMHMSTIVDDEKCELIFLYKLVDGVASSSFGTHVANLAGVPMDVIKRAEVISTDFARQFKARIEGRKTSTLPLVAQADFSYLMRLATGKENLPQNALRKRLIMRSLRDAAARYVALSESK